MRIKSTIAVPYLSALFCSIACIAITGCQVENEPEQEPTHHHDNIFASTQNWYVQRPWSEKVAAEGHTEIAQHSTAIWLETLEDVNPEIGYIDNVDHRLTEDDTLRLPLRDHLHAATAQNNALVQLVLHNTPEQDCAAEASIRQLPASSQGFQVYKEEYIDRINNIIRDYPQLPIVIYVEPYSLAYLVSHNQVERCRRVSNQHSWGYTNAIRYAINTLSQHQNVHIYLDIAASNITGKDADFQMATNFYHGVLNGFSDSLIQKALGDAANIEANPGATGLYSDISELFLEAPTVAGVNTSPPGYEKIDGFVSNINDYVPLDEPYLGDPRLPEGESPLRSNYFYEWNPRIDEWTYTQEWLQQIQNLNTTLESLNNPEDTSHLGVVIDTSRNGWGQSHIRLQGAQEVSEPDQVDSHRLDQRQYRRNWCNIAGGIGRRPQSAPDNKPWIDAYTWVHELGKSQGASSLDSPINPFWPIRYYQPMCDSNEFSYLAQESDFAAHLNLGNDAMDLAPPDWRWFSDGLNAQIDNAWPPICEGFNDHCTTTPASPH